jgi:hypothetical protein
MFVSYTCCIIYFVYAVKVKFALTMGLG